MPSATVIDMKTRERVPANKHARKQALKEEIAALQPLKLSICCMLDEMHTEGFNINTGVMLFESADDGVAIVGMPANQEITGQVTLLRAAIAKLLLSEDGQNDE